MDIYLRTYRLSRMVNQFVDFWQRTVSTTNHCSIRADDLVVHLFDEETKPRWISQSVDTKFFNPVEEVYIGQCNQSLRELHTMIANLPVPSLYDRRCRYVWYCTFGIWPKRKDCVDHCSNVLNYLFNFPRCYSTPDRLINNAKDWKRRIRGTD